jgi:hypothetical protein
MPYQPGYLILPLRGGREWPTFKSTRPEPKPSALKTTKSDQLVALQRRNSREIPVPGGGAIVQLGAAATDACAKAHDGVVVNAVIRFTERMLMPSVRAAMISIYLSGRGY